MTKAVSLLVGTMRGDKDCCREGDKKVTRHSCAHCGTPLKSDEVALTKKMISRMITHYFCLDCLAAAYSTTRRQLQELIDYYHRTGECTLFAKVGE